MLTIAPELHAKIIAHARADHPDEACGVIAGPAGSDRPERFIPMLNAERSPTFYRFDSMEQLRVWREKGDRGEGAVVIYHSPPPPPAHPPPPHNSPPPEPRGPPLPVSPPAPDPAQVPAFS